jgi:hypothetical protein
VKYRKDNELPIADAKKYRIRKSGNANASHVTEHYRKTAGSSACRLQSALYFKDEFSS